MTITDQGEEVAHLGASHDVPRLVDPIWMEPAEVPERQAAVAGWAASLEKDPAGTIFLHPELVLSRQLVRSDPPWIYARWGEGPRPQPSSLAVLAPKAFTVRFAPGLRCTLRGRRLVGNQVLGDNHPAALDAFVRALAGACAARRSECVLVEDVEVGSPLWEALARAEKEHRNLHVFYPVEPQPHWRIIFPEVPKDYWNQFSKKSRYNLRRSAKLLEHSVCCYRTVQDVAEFLRKAHEVSQQSWQSKRRGLRVKNTESERRYLEAIAAQGGLRSYVLQKGSHPLAFVLAFQWKGSFLYEEIGYDAAFAESSPGNVLLVRILDDLIEHDTPAVFDFGLGDGGYKQLFGNHQTSSGPVLLVQRNWRPLVAMRLFQFRKFLSEKLRAVVKRLGVWRALRRLYRR